MEIYTTKSESRIASLSRGSKHEDTGAFLGKLYCSVQFETGGKVRRSYIEDPAGFQEQDVSEWVKHDLYMGLAGRGLSWKQINDVLRELWDSPEGETLYVMAR